MPVPRIFVSSTCYDLQEIRYNLRDFIKGFAYEPVMSEFGDIFFDYNQHVQDSCINEIQKCQMYILIIGNNYGSTYYREQPNAKSFDSITLQEFKKSLELKLPKHIFINRFVNYDYKNYRRALDNKFKKYFDDNEVEEDVIISIKEKLRDELNSDYYFANEAYRHIFKFLDIIYELKSNNAIFEFEAFNEIQIQLKQQWAYYVYERLSEKKDDSIDKRFIEIKQELSGKMDSISNLVKDIFNKPIEDDGTIHFDLDKYKSGLSYTELQDAQETIDSLIRNILYISEEDYNENCYYTNPKYSYKRGAFLESMTVEKISEWLNSLDNLLKKYKWSKKLKFNEIWNNFKVENNSIEYEVEYKTLLDINVIYKQIEVEERQNFAESVKRLVDECCINECDNLEAAVDNNELPF